MKLYRHYKGGVYVILLEGLTVQYTETGETMVVYRQISTGWNFTRPQAVFLGQAVKDGALVRRFEPIEACDLSREEAVNLREHG